MRRYGSTRGRMYGGLMAYEDCRPAECRGNRGRNRSAAFPPFFGGHWARNKHFSAPIDIAIRRSLRKAARQQGQKEIAEELGLWQLERDFSRAMQRPRRWKDASARMFIPILSEQDLDRAVSDALYTADDYDAFMKDLIEMERDTDDARDEELGRRTSPRRQLHDELDSWSYNGDSDWEYMGDQPDEEPEPDRTDPHWRDLWIAGRVHDHDNELDVDCDRDRFGYEDFCYDCGEYYAYCQCEVWMFAPRLPEDSAIHGDDDRNNERLRAGKRYYQTYRRAVPIAKLAKASQTHGKSV